jgi:hypothetical protein
MEWNIRTVWHKRMVGLERTIGTFRLERTGCVRLERMVRAERGVRLVGLVGTVWNIWMERVVGTVWNIWMERVVGTVWIERMVWN